MVIRMGSPLLLVAMLVLLPVILANPVLHNIAKRNALDNDADYINRNDEDQIFMENSQTSKDKRAALLLDRLMVELQKAVDGNDKNLNSRRPSTLSLGSNEASFPKDLQRRGQPKNKNYWRCYFNAVSCFKRK
ncbi:uncharacterized protein [Prorops nasuta]|uniref:uncharacterized protein n=1 Tax=Prorops nasuta TaxID=863751 RepID=UPI0034CF0401